MVTMLFELPWRNLISAELQSEMALKMRKNRSPKPPEPCLLTECMQVIAGAWAPNVIWSLRAGPRRFNELKNDIPPVSSKVLSARLTELEERGVLLRHVRPTSPPSVEYELTELGEELIPALEAIVQVGYKLKRLRGYNPESEVAE